FDLLFGVVISGAGRDNKNLFVPLAGWHGQSFDLIKAWQPDDFGPLGQSQTGKDSGWMCA
ncbi:hypothetical protein ABTM58_21130, partial [Acinetobacter baumannii]